MGVASKIPVAGEGDRLGAEGEAHRSDHQKYGGVIQSRTSDKNRVRAGGSSLSGYFPSDPKKDPVELL